MIIREQILPGLMRGELAGGRFNGLPVVTKAGAFGQDDTMNPLVNWSFAHETDIHAAPAGYLTMMGGPGGIGHEICAKALGDPEICKVCRPMVIGDAAIMADAISF